MVNLPKTLQTRTDYLFALQLAQQHPRLAEAAIAHFQGLLNNLSTYVFIKNLEEGEQAPGDAPEYRVLENEEGERTLLQLQENPNAELLKLGFSAAEVTNYIDELKEL